MASVRPATAPVDSINPLASPTSAVDPPLTPGAHHHDVNMVKVEATLANKEPTAAEIIAEAAARSAARREAREVARAAELAKSRTVPEMLLDADVVVEDKREADKEAEVVLSWEDMRAAREAELAEKKRRKAAAEAAKLAKNRARAIKAQERNRANDARLVEETKAAIKADRAERSKLIKVEQPFKCNICTNIKIPWFGGHGCKSEVFNVTDFQIGVLDGDMRYTGEVLCQSRKGPSRSEEYECTGRHYVHGEGELSLPNGDIIKGRWRQDNFMTVGEAILQDGKCFFKGKFTKEPMKRARSKSPRRRSRSPGRGRSCSPSSPSEPYPLAKGSYPVPPNTRGGSVERDASESPGDAEDDQDEAGADDDPENSPSDRGRSQSRDRPQAVEAKHIFVWPPWRPDVGVMKNYVYPNGDVYNGEWGGGGCRHGVGTCVYAGSGDTYKGQWADDKWHGEGVYTYQDGTTITGPFADNTPGLEQAPPKPGSGGAPFNVARPPSPTKNQIADEEATYKAALEKDEIKPIPSKREVAHRAIFHKQQPLQGQARFDFLNGGYFTGAWKDGEPWEGKMVKCPYFQEPQSFDGNLKDGMRADRGVAVYKNGDRYEGDWKKNLRDGTGTLDCGPRGVFQGSFKADEMWEGHMEGLLLGNGDRYSGQYVEGKRHGQGTLWYAKGGLFKGEFRNDRTHQGKMEPTAVWNPKELRKKNKGPPRVHFGE